MRWSRETSRRNSIWPLTKLETNVAPMNQSLLELSLGASIMFDSSRTTMEMNKLHNGLSSVSTNYKITPSTNRNRSARLWETEHGQLHSWQVLIIGTSNQGPKKSTRPQTASRIGKQHQKGKTLLLSMKSATANRMVLTTLEEQTEIVGKTSTFLVFQFKNEIISDVYMYMISHT